MPFNVSTFAINRTTLNLFVAHQRTRHVVKVEVYSYVSTSLDQALRFIDHIHALIGEREGLAQLSLVEQETPAQSAMTLLTQLQERSTQQEERLTQLEEQLVKLIDQKIEAKFAEHIED